MAVFPVILDSCVLYPMYLRDTLLWAAEAGLYRVYWSQEILNGAIRNLVANGQITEEQALRLERQMKLAFPEALVEVTERLIPCMDNHPGDRKSIILTQTYGMRK
jgi:ABC-type arginine/histidine transport system permease subunit